MFLATEFFSQSDSQCGHHNTLKKFASNESICRGIEVIFAFRGWNKGQISKARLPRIKYL